MAKLICAERITFDINLDKAKVTVISYRDQGVTLAAAYTSTTKSHFKLAITHCSPSDKFKRKRGFNSVMEKVWNNSYIIMPAQSFLIENEMDQFMENNFYFMYENGNSRKVIV